MADENVSTEVDEQTALEEAAEATAKAEEERLAAEDKARRADAALAQTKHIQGLREALDARATKWYMPAKEIAVLLAKEPGFRFEIGAEPAIDGQRVSLDEMLAVFESRHKHLHDETIAERQEKQAQKKYATIRSKEDLATRADKIAFIDKFGVDAFAKLPLYNTADKSWNELTSYEYARLPMAEKVQCVKKYGADAITRSCTANDRKAQEKQSHEQRESIFKKRG